MKITISTAATMLILQQLQLTTAIDNTSTHHDYMPILRGVKQHAQLAGYIATDSTDPYWSQFNNAMSVHNGNLKPVQQKAEKNDDIIILEAYAQWCGFCQAIAPFYDGAAKHFNNVGGLFLSKVDVGGADQGNQDLANDLGLTGFPTFYYGKSEDFDDVKNNPPSQLNELRSMTSTNEMIEFLSERFDIDQSDDIDTPDDDDTHSVNEKNALIYTIGVDAYLSDIEKSTSDSLQQALLSTTLISKEGAREAFIDWQTWISDSHPSSKCRDGARDILDDLDDLWPVSASPSKARSNLMDVNQCIDDYSSVPYEGCAAGGNPGKSLCSLICLPFQITCSNRSYNHLSFIS